MRFVVLLIVLGFPVLDLYATVRFARWTGVPVYGMARAVDDRGTLAAAQRARRVPRATPLPRLHGEQPLLRGLFDSGRKVLAGFLFLLPGSSRDLMALVAARAAAQRRPRVASRMPRRRRTRGDAIDGEYRRLE